ncbi:MAG: hypothetical protein P8M05_06915 [Flavobacteriales bacterium]|nr:hypothetical protein [Flavobacteriales bacterium]
MGLTYSQKCIESHTGKYKVNLSATMDNLKKIEKEKGQEIPEEHIEMMNVQLGQIELSINQDTLVMSVMGRSQKIPFLARSNADGSSCDMVMQLTKEQLPEGTKEVYMTIHSIDKNSIRLKSTGGSADMDNYIWSKLE